MTNVSSPTGSTDSEKDTAAPATSDEALHLEIIRIKREYPFKGDYREQLAALLAILFFKFGERVGAGRLAALLAENGKSPSTSTAQSEINKFWDKVRQHASVKIERPDVPEFLLELFGQMAAKTWGNCMTAANSAFIDLRDEQSRQVEVALSSARAIQALLEEAQGAAQQARLEAAQANERREVVTSQLAVESALKNEADSLLRAMAERLEREQQLRTEESTRMTSTLQELRETLNLSTIEQRRLLVVSDDFKQQAARDRAQRLKSEETIAILTQAEESSRQRVASLVLEKGLLEGRLEAQFLQLEQLRVLAVETQLKMSEAPAASSIRRTGLRLKNRRQSP